MYTYERLFCSISPGDAEPDRGLAATLTWLVNTLGNPLRRKEVNKV